jgi:hypothetical protein
MSRPRVMLASGVSASLFVGFAVTGMGVAGPPDSTAVGGTSATTVDSIVAGPTEAPSTAPPSQLPEGRYITEELSRDDLLATGVNAGFDEADVNAFLDADGVHETAVYSLLIADGGLTLYYVYDGGAEAVWARGTYEVVDDDTVVVTDPEGSITFEYTLDGDALALDVVEDPCPGCTDWIAPTVALESAPFVLESPATESVPEGAPSSYRSTTFVIAFEVTVPEWADPEPSTVLPNFVTWEGTTIDRGIRFLAPLSVYQPGETAAGPVPDDYLAYLLAQSDDGVDFADVTETTVDGRPASVFTATTDTSLDGSIGCQEEDLAAEDCFGFQPELVLHAAVIDTGTQPLIIWVRDIRGAGDGSPEYDTFDAMLASLRFLDATPATTSG